MRVGSEEHKRLFCESFLSSHRSYEPDRLPFPALDPATQALLAGVPFWAEALHTERRAGVMLQAFADATADPMLREAIALQALEEARHGRVIAALLATYGISVSERPVDGIPEQPDELETAFTQFGYGECVDSFFAFGMYRIVGGLAVVPESLSRLFDPVLDEEARHIVFFVNFVAYTDALARRRHKRGLNYLLQYAGAAMRRLDALKSNGAATSDGEPRRGFTATGAGAFGRVTPTQFLSVCLAENERRMQGFDPRLLRPRFLPALGAAALRTARLLPRRLRAR